MILGHQAVKNITRCEHLDEKEILYFSKLLMWKDVEYLNFRDGKLIHYL